MNASLRYVVTSVVSLIAGISGTLAFLSVRSSGTGETTDGGPPLTLVLEGTGGHPGPGTTELAIDDPRISFRQLTAVAGRLAAADPEAAVRRAKEIPGHDNREAYLGEVLRAWGEKDGVAAATFANDYFQGQQLTDALYYIADGWAEADPAAAADWFNKNTASSVLDDAMWEALESWGRKDPRAALAWSGANLDDYVKSTAMQGLAEGWGAVDPEGAAAAGLEMRDTSYGQEFLVSVMTQWAGSDPEKAAVWAGGLVNEQLRAGVVHELAQIWTQTDPLKAAEWAKSLVDPGARRAAEMGMAVGWSEHDPGGAVEWALSSIADEEQLEEMVGDIVFNWSNLDPRGATQWLERQPVGPRTDRVLKSFSETIFDEDPASSVAWAARIADPAARDKQVRSLLDGLVATYGNTAKTAIQGYQIADEIKRDYAPE